MCDGASAAILATEETCAKYNLEPIARIVSYNSVGCDPKIMGIGPVPAINNALKAADLSLADMDLCEVLMNFFLLKYWE